MTRARKSGSALLIVLGFLSFMVVSAVAFAIYMRAERQPSSALRRTVATRHLVQAAMAEAIARVDDAVRGDPFPGLCPTNSDTTAAGEKTYKVNDYVADFWEGRVFMPPDPQGGTTSRETRFAPVTETVSVLTLEGLGYLPPAFVNDVRFLSRSSWAAQWQPLPFDAGRFAYCAVNVSDCFDINRLYANRGRTSEASGRLSLGYLFDSSFDPTADPDKGGNVGDTVNMGDAASFDTFVHSSRSDGDDKGNDGTMAVTGNTTPFVSMLDYNLALGRNGGSTALRPLFYEWISGNTSAGATYYIADSTESKSAARQPFVTDSVTTNEKWTVDLATAKGQPFYGVDMTKKSTPLGIDDIYNRIPRNGLIELGQNANILDPLDKWLLWDYLDHDNVPLSLAMPCMERVPMIVALESQVKMQPGEITAGASSTEGSAASGQTTKLTPYTFNPQEWFPGGGGSIKAVVVFPFKHGASRPSGTFKAQAYVRLFLVPKSKISDVNSSNFRNGLAKSLRPQDANTWTARDGNENKMESQFSLAIAAQEVTLSIEDVPQDESDVHCEESISFDLMLDDVLPNSATLVTKKEVQTYNTETGATVGEPETTWLVNARPYTDLDGTLSEAEYTDLTTLDSNGAFVPCVCVWVRIVNSDNKTVDLVPAWYQDDQLNGIDPEAPFRDELNDSFGGAAVSAPMMRFIGEGELTFASVPDLRFGAPSTAWSPKSMYTVDPRFNWAPEAWYYVDASGITFDNWLSKTRSALSMGEETATRNGVSEDVFLFTSNQGILQSLGEFAFLPNLSRSNIGTVDFNGTLRDNAGSTRFSGSSFCSHVIDRSWYDQWAAVGVGRSTEKECLVNPYTDSRAIMMAALANTPVDYWAAARCMSDDCELRKNGGNLINKTDKWYKTPDQALQRAFCSKAESSGDRMACSDVVRFADVLRKQMHDKTIELLKNWDGTSNPADLWKDVWDDLSWDMWQNDDSKTKFLGLDRDLQNNVALHSVDRKFLYSYWRDCFANNQQLFLIFVRAESNVLGGPGEGTPAQQGGRAVALVWRNPSATRQQGRNYDAQNTYDTNGEREPHQTRILFYHQFD